MEDYKRYIRESTVHDVYKIANNLREGDKREAAAFGFRDPALGVIASFVGSQRCLTLLSPDDRLEPVVLLGVSDSPHENWGLIWMVSTDELPKYSIRFLRHCRTVLDDLFNGYEALHNYVHVDNELHHKWLRWLNFTFLERTEGKYGSFYGFIKLKTER